MRLGWLPGRRRIGRVADHVRGWPIVRRRPVRFVASAVRARRHGDEFDDLGRYVVFIGHPRSGHSMVGSLLDAHPDVVISHELDALHYVRSGYRRAQLLTLIIERSAQNAATGRRSWEYSYAVPGQWQGRFDRLTVVGDKRGARTTAQLAEQPELLDQLRRLVQVPVSIVQVIRNPFDNIATMWRRGDEPLEAQIERYFRLAATTDRVADRVDPSVLHRVRMEDVIADPRARLVELCAFLGVTPTPAYLDACASIVFPAPKQTRDDAPWTDELRAEVVRRTSAHTWLAPYLDESA